MFRTNSRSQILFLTDIFRKLTLGAPEHLAPLEVYVVGRWRLLPNQRWLEIPRGTKLHPRGEGWPQSLPFLALRHCSHPYTRFLLPFNTEREKRLWSIWATASFDNVYGGTRWTNQTLLFQSMLRRVKRLKPFLSVAIFPFLRFFKLNMSIEIKHKYKLAPPPSTWGRNPGYLTCWCTPKGGNLTTVTAIGVKNLMAYGIRRGLKQIVSVSC